MRLVAKVKILNVLFDFMGVLLSLVLLELFCSLWVSVRIPIRRGTKATSLFTIASTVGDMIYASRARTWIDYVLSRIRLPQALTPKLLQYLLIHMIAKSRIS